MPIPIEPKELIAIAIGILLTYLGLRGKREEADINSLNVDVETRRFITKMAESLHEENKKLKEENQRQAGEIDKLRTELQLVKEDARAQIERVKKEADQVIETLMERIEKMDREISTLKGDAPKRLSA